jgi:non-canonical purine NTP pyrophosphatase (RdgB/HAM1 family)
LASAPDSGPALSTRHVRRLLLASSNPGKLRELCVLASETASPPALDLLPGFSRLPPFVESAPTFAENAVGKALHYSRYSDLPVFADDSGLVVDALGGRPGVHSARYGGTNASDADRVAKLLAELRAANASDRSARFVCVLALACRGQVLGVFSDAVEGQIAESPRGANGFGYDPIFLLPALRRTFAEIPGESKNLSSHRGKAFRKLLAYLSSNPPF